MEAGDPTTREGPRRGVGARVRLEKIIGFFFRVHPDFRRIFVHLVEMVKNSAVEIIDLQQAVQVRVSAGVFLAHDQVSCSLAGIFEMDVLPFDIKVGKSFILYVHSVFGMSYRGEPPFTDKSSLSGIVELLR